MCLSGQKGSEQRAVPHRKAVAIASHGKVCRTNANFKRARIMETRRKDTHEIGCFLVLFVFFSIQEIRNVRIKGTQGNS